MPNAPGKRVPRRKAGLARGHHVRTAAKHNMLELYVDKVSRADPNGLIAMEREGVPGVLIKDLGKGFRLSQERFFRIVGAPKATIERKASSKKRVAGSVGVATLGVVRLLALARSMVARSQSPEARDFDVAAWLGTWLETPQPALGGRRPAEMLDTPTGFAVVERTLGALESGAYL